MKSYYGNHLGIVINSIDPENRGRVQVFIPHITNTLYAGWNENVDNDIEFKNIGTDAGLNPGIVERLKTILPWAEGAMPIWGGGTPTSYNFSTDTLSTNRAEVLGSPIKATSDQQLNVLRYVQSIGVRETEFSVKEAKTNGNNLISNNANVRKGVNNENLSLAAAQAKYGDYGYYQTNSTDVAQARASGLVDNPDALNNGGGKGNYSLEEQTLAMTQYLKVVSPKGYELIQNGGEENYAAANSYYKGKWPSLPGGGSYHSSLDSIANSYLNGTKSAVTISNVPKEDNSDVSKQTADSTSAQSDSRGLDDPSLPPLPPLPEDVSKPVQDVNQQSSGLAAKPTTQGGVGMLSIPKPGAKVWVFFHGGDVQRPVYFAHQPDPPSIQQMLSIKDGVNNLDENIENSSQQAQANIIQSSEGSLSMVSHIVKDPENSITHKDQGYVRLADKNGNHQTMTADGTFHNVAGSFTKKIAGTAYTTVRGGEERLVNGVTNLIHKDDYYLQVGRQSEKEHQVAIELQQTLGQIHQDQQDYIQNHAQDSYTLDCPVCQTEYLDNNSCISSILGFVRTLIPPYFSFALDLLDFIGGAASAVLPSSKTAFSLNGGSCGNPFCKNGKIPDVLPAILAANEASIQQLRRRQPEIQDLENQLGQGGSFMLRGSKDIYLGAGLGDINNCNPYTSVGYNNFSAELKPADKTPTNCILKSNAYESHMHTDPPQIPGGNFVIHANNKVSVIAGSPGIDISTQGKLKINVGDLELAATSADLILSSKGTSILKGTGVILEAGSENSGGIILRSKRTLAEGSLSVTGDAAFKGSVTMDGELSTPFLVVPSMRTKSTLSSGPDAVTNDAHWGAGAIAVYDENVAKNAITHYAEPGYLTTISGILHFAKSIYTSAAFTTFLEILPTGICITDEGIGIVYNYVHNHGLSPQDHTHDVSIPKGSYTNDLGSWAQERGQNNFVPIPARSHGDSTSPGPRSHGSCGLCGSAGGFVTSSEAGNDIPANPFNSNGQIRTDIPTQTGSNCL